MDDAADFLIENTDGLSDYSFRLCLDDQANQRQLSHQAGKSSIPRQILLLQVAFECSGIILANSGQIDLNIVFLSIEDIPHFLQ